jgi:hypothetical protein
MEVGEGRPAPGEEAARPEPSALQVAAWGAGGAAMGLVLPGTLLKVYHEGHLVQFGLALLLGAIFINVVEPQLRSRLAADHPEPRPGHPVQRTLLGALLGVPLVLLFELIHAGLSHDSVDFLGFAMLSFVTCGVITYLWARAARQRRPQATRDGALGGFLVGYAVPSLLIVGSLGAALPLLDNFKLGELSGDRAVVAALAILLMNALNWAFWGLLGGIVIDGQWFRRPSLAVGGALVVGAVIPGMLVFALSSGDVSMLPSLVVVDLARAVGWGLGLFFCRASDEAFTVERASRTTLYVSGGLVAACAFTAVVGFTYRSTPSVVLQEDFKITDSSKLPPDFDIGDGCQRVFIEAGFILRDGATPCQVQLDRTFTSNIRIELAVRLRAGTEQARYGLKFARRSDPASFHLLLISPKGTYALWYYKAGHPEPFTDLLAGTKIVPAVKKRHGDVNLLQVAISGSRLACYINDQEVCSLSDREDMGGRIGLYLDRGAEAKFERLLITALPPVRPATRPAREPVTPARSPDR